MFCTCTDYEYVSIIGPASVLTRFLRYLQMTVLNLGKVCVLFMFLFTIMEKAYRNG
jgi:hypothetical protein